MARGVISRRALVRGAVWTAPVIARTVAVPLDVASIWNGIRVRVMVPDAQGACVPAGTEFSSPFATVTAWRGLSGIMFPFEVLFSFRSSDGGTIVIDGETYPGSSVPVVRSSFEYAAVLEHATAGAPGSVVVLATLSDAGQSATFAGGTVRIC